jgi:quercetin dioxygenase-like cupin family protein
MLLSRLAVLRFSKAAGADRPEELRWQTRARCRHYTVGAQGLSMHIVVIPPGARGEPHKHVGYETASTYWKGVAALAGVRRGSTNW